MTIQASEQPAYIEVPCVECGNFTLVVGGPKTLKCDTCGNSQHDMRGECVSAPIQPPADAVIEDELP